MYPQVCAYACLPCVEVSAPEAGTSVRWRSPTIRCGQPCDHNQRQCLAVGLTVELLLLTKYQV